MVSKNTCARKVVAIPNRSGSETFTLIVVDDDNVRTIGFANDASTVSEGATTTLGLEFTGCTIPSDGVTLRFGVSGTAELTGSNTDATYDEGTIIPNTLSVLLTLADNANPSFSIDIAADTTRFEPDETVIFTLRGDDLPAGVTPGSITAHTISIPANSNIAFFESDANSATVNEADAGAATRTVSFRYACGDTAGNGMMSAGSFF